jgi:rhamnogalacturonyl hydrolase YesR
MAANRTFGALILCLAAALAAPAAPAAQAGGSGSAWPTGDAVPSAPGPIPWRRADVIALAEKVGGYQLAAMAAGLKPNPAAAYPDPRGWEQGALLVGLAALADHSARPEFSAMLLARGEANGWRLGDNVYDADDHVIGASYFWSSRHGAGDQAIAPMRARLDEILAAPPAGDLAFVGDGSTCRHRWCWCDALFMAPPVWLEMSRVTGDPRYADHAERELRATTQALYDEAAHLYFRDSRFFERRDVNGNKLFWSRGNGWVFAGLARMIPLLPAGDPERLHMQALFKDMAATLAGLQKPDGFWSPSLLGDPAASLPESSGTGFFTYGLAWGVAAGLLDKAAYEPHVRRGWAALVRSVHPDGKLGFVQPVSDRPDAVGYDDTQLYGVGAFLLAACALADLDLSAPAVAATLEVSNPSRFDQGAAIGAIRIALPEDSAGGWSVEAGGRIYPAIHAAGTLRFVVPIRSGQTLRARVYPQPAALPGFVQAVLNVQDGGSARDGVIRGGSFHLRKSYAVPAGHAIHDGLIAFEGVGWESDRIAYRLYLDERNATDIYGKKLPGAILPVIGQGSGDYHAMSEWGQDIFQVDQSLGIGGIGMLREGRAGQIGPSTITAEVANTAISGEATVSNVGFDGGRATLRASYRIYNGQALTFVDAAVRGATVPMVAGFRHHERATLLAGNARGDWNYIASWGLQDLTGDGLGLAVFFHPAEVRGGPGDDGQSWFLAFNDPASLHYAFAATWARDASGVRDLEGFRAWLDATMDALNHPLLVQSVPTLPKRARP